jgi:hypothetical protein
MDRPQREPRTSCDRNFACFYRQRRISFGGQQAVVNVGDESRRATANSCADGSIALVGSDYSRWLCTLLTWWSR